MKKQKSKIGFLLLGAIAAFAMFAFGNAELGLSLAMVAPVVIAAGKSSLELKQERKSVSDQIDAIVNRAKGENREYTAEEVKELRQLQDNYDKYTSHIELEMANEKRAAAAAAGIITRGNSEEKEKGKFSFSKLLNELTRSAGDVTKVTGLEREMLEESSKEARSLGISPGGIYLSNDLMNVVHKRTMVVGTPTAGGNFIPTEKLGFFDALYNATVLAELGVQTLTGLSANTDLKGLSTGASTAWGGETATISPADLSTAARELRPNTLSSAMDISRTLATQTNNSIDQYLMQSMMRAMRVALEAAVINGDGSDKPLGILGTSNIQDVAMGTNGGAISYAKLLELAEKVKTAGANEANCRWLTNFKVERTLKQTPIEAATGAMILAYMQYFGGVQGMVDGKPINFTQNVPSNLTKGSTSGSCSALIYGDFTNVVIGQYGGMELSIDSTSAAVVRAQKVAITMTQLVDSTVLQPAALGAIKDITTA